MLSILTALALSTPAHAVSTPAEPLSLLAELSAPRAEPFAPQDDASEPQNGGFSYTYFEIGATQFNADEIDDEADIYYGKASLGLFKFLYIFAGYENQSVDFENIDSDVIRLGAGAHFGITPKLDLVGDVAWLYSDTSSDLDDLDDTTDGFEVHVGGRWMPLGWDGGGLEIHGGGVYVDMEDTFASDDSATGFDVGGKLHFLRLFSVGAVYTMLEDDDSVGVNARVSF